jgi:hypothetical protein
MHRNGHARCFVEGGFETRACFGQFVTKESIQVFNFCSFVTKNSIKNRLKTPHRLKTPLWTLHDDGLITNMAMA